MTTLDNPCAVIDLTFRQGEPLSWTTTVAGADWSGTYTAHIVSGAAIIAVLTVVGVFNDPDTAVTIELSEATSLTIPPGYYRWAARLPSGEVHFRGGVAVESEPVGLA